MGLGRRGARRVGAFADVGGFCALALDGSPLLGMRGLLALLARACGKLGIDAPGLKGREALPIPKAADVAPEPGAQAMAARAAACKNVSGEAGGGKHI